MTYQEAMAFLEETKKYGSVLGLDSIRALMRQLGNVQNQLSVIHVAGTNGKGSVCAFLSSVYRAAGYHVCRFSTPDVFSYEEEFLCDEVPIGKDELAEVFSVVQKACEKMVSDGMSHPTRFEVETAAAFLWFSMKKPDLCIIEVGMGGETDATNVIEKPAASVLTSISMDHMGFLGNSLAQIGTVKAGIIKPGCPAISTWQEPEVEAVIREKAITCGSRLIFSDAEVLRKGFSYECSLQGSFQRQNALLALDVVRCLEEKFPVHEDDIQYGLANTKWPGRFELLGTEPEFYIDGAHNTGAAKQLRKTLDEMFPDSRIVYIMGVLADKEYEEIADIMFREGDVVYCITPENPRALDARELADVLQDRDIRAYECQDMNKTVETALELAELSEGVVLAFGSLSYLKDVKSAYLNVCNHRE